jgi:predicted RNA binding protein YcfA (HicA-like mRNA interferase family)
MPKLLIIKSKTFVKTLKNLGFVKHRQRGTLRGILRDIEISPNEFIKALKK